MPMELNYIFINFFVQPYTSLLIFQFFISDTHKVHCSESAMKVDIVLPEQTDKDSPAQVYLEGMKGYPNPKCRPTITGNLAQFELSLIDFYECGITLLHNKITVKKRRFLTRPILNSI